MMPKLLQPRRLATVAALTLVWCSLWGDLAAGTVIAGLAVATVVTSIGVHGSGHVDRSDLYQNEAARFFAPRGVAFFMYDKRGIGESDGEYMPTGFTEEGDDRDRRRGGQGATPTRRAGSPCR